MIGGLFSGEFTLSDSLAITRCDSISGPRLHCFYEN